MRYDPEIIEREARRNHPDYILFKPETQEYESDNEHIYVFWHERYAGLLAFWTQSSVEGYGNNHLVMARSRDNGITWTAPEYILGTKRKEGNSAKQASWGVPVVSASGRIYLFYFRETDYIDTDRQATAAFSCVYSDDIGESWSESTDLPVRMTPYDGGEIQNNIIFQMPIRTPDGAVLFGYTKSTSNKVFPYSKDWWENDTHCYFMRLENIDEDPLPAAFRFTYLPDDDRGIGMRAVRRDGTVYSSAQEPCPVILPDGRIFSTLRTTLGYVAYTVSEDGGHTFSEPKALKREDGSVFVHPLSPCPIYEMPEKGQYMLLYHNRAEPVGKARNLLYRAFGEYTPDAEQPITFKTGSGERFMEIPRENELPQIRDDLAMYSSVTYSGGKMILWYPERKFFVLGREICR